MARLTLLVVVSVALVLFVKVGAFPFENEAVIAAPAEAKRLSSVETLTIGTTEACKREGGLCVTKSQCPKDKLASKRGLCGGDKECCFSLPAEITDCGERGGICRPSSECKGAPRDPFGQCVTGQVCCVLIR